jgi:hypothetical protein
MIQHQLYTSQLTHLAFAIAIRWSASAIAQAHLRCPNLVLRGSVVVRHVANDSNQLALQSIRTRRCEACFAVFLGTLGCAGTCSYCVVLF